MVVASGLQKQNGVAGTSTMNGAVDVVNNNNNTIPAGKYTLVGIDIDTTGRRLIDEIVQLAAYTTKDHFEQYIMPYMNLNPAARQRHQVRVISIGFYRMLKSMQTYKIIKSKSEIAALRDFLDWLEDIKAKDVNSMGIILLYHEERKFIPYMILESLKKYNLLDRFLKTVASFANGLNLAKANANASLQHYTLRKLSKFLKQNVTNNEMMLNNNNNNVNMENANGHDGDKASMQQQQPKNKPNRNFQNNERDLFDGNASVRAKLAYEVALHLSNQDGKLPLDSINAYERMLAALHPYAYPIKCDLNELQTENENLERQNSFRPVFLNYFKTTIYHRVRAVKFRIVLAEHGYDLQTLNAIWMEKKRNGLEEVFKVIDELKFNDKIELTDLFDSYFDPGKATIKPIIKPGNRRRNRRGGRNNGRNDGNGTNNQRGGGGSSTEQGAGGDKQGTNTTTMTSMADSTTKSPKPQRGKRNSRIRQNSVKAGTNNGANNSAANANNANAMTTPPVAATN